MRAHASPRLAALALLLLVAAGCAELLKPAEPPRPAPPAPQITEQTLRQRAQSQLTAGVMQYEAGDYDNALKTLSASLDHGLLTKVEQSVARKHVAFIHCVSGREPQCRDEFRKAFEIHGDFSLSAAEDGHPIWGPVYRDVRTRLIAEREAAAATARPAAKLAKAEQLLADGLLQYDAGDYDVALTLLEAAIREGLSEKAAKVRAHKHVSFTLCLKERYRDCRAEFLKIFEVDPAFDLTPAEIGHPSWTRTFASAKAQAKKAQRERQLRDEREARARAAKEKAAAPAPAAPAAVPKKN